ncbi:class I SAM-dependent methyltransferase [Flindersiella endophytica]
MTTWDDIAERYDEYTTPKSLQYGAEILDLLGIGGSMRFLDVAAGSGALSIPAARSGADVLATDLSPVMMERLRARARSEGLTRLETEVMDGLDLKLADDSFDVAASQHGVSLFPEVGRGLAELVRVTKPGGKVVVVAFGAFQKAEFIGFLLSAMQAAVPGFTGLAADAPPPPFQLSDPAVFRARLTEAGLRDVRVDTISCDTPFDSARHLWDMVTSSNPIGADMVAGLTAEQRAEVRHVLDGILRERSGGSPGAVLHLELNIGTGTKPDPRAVQP